MSRHNQAWAPLLSSRPFSVTQRDVSGATHLPEGLTGLTIKTLEQQKSKPRP